MFNQLRPTQLVLVCLVLSTTWASAQTLQGAREQITLRATVESIDHTARTVTVRGDGGSVVTIDVPKTVTRFEEIKVGDVVRLSYYDRVRIRVKPEGEAAVDRTLPPLAISTPGDLPGATLASQREVTVTITGWDATNRVVSFTGPNGTAYTRHLLDTTDASIVAGLKVGDRVDVTRTEAVEIGVESRTTATVDATPDFRHRFTISALYGTDNQFTGHMIQAANGQTTTGLPINLGETTYDDVYGRMTNFTIGLGYRTTPKTEGVLNLVFSRSASQTVTIGTIGASNTPLNVNFDDYSYWGVEGGQRVYFARKRFTPFVGYLVGLNRYGDIRGNFVGVPPEATPGLAAQDGKFFEKSWAFSVGPTGGLLIGVGPIELMAHLQLRYMGGLSDVDWLVEEGLRDINSESSRWSLPAQAGVRFRF